MNLRLTSAQLAICLALCCAGLAQAQVSASSTTQGASVAGNTELATGWSVKRNLMGKIVHNEKGERVGRVRDLILAPDKRVLYVIVGVGGFAGLGRHDVAVPIAQLQDEAGKPVMPGASRESLKALPAFDYANDRMLREQFIAAAEKDVAQAKTAIADLEKKLATATADAKVRLNEQIAALKEQVQAVETKLTELKNASARRWHEFEAAVSAATARLRDSLKSGTP